MMLVAQGTEVIPVTPSYWEEACKYLIKKDRVMRKLIPKFGDACLQTRGDAFVTLARSIVGQQISVPSAQKVWDRFALLPRKITPANVLRLKVDDMRAAGLSARKVEYLVDLALHFDNGTLHVSSWHNMPDDEIIAVLIEHWCKTDHKMHVQVTYKALRAILDLSRRYLPKGAFPGKAIEVMEDGADGRGGGGQNQWRIL